MNSKEETNVSIESKRGTRQVQRGRNKPQVFIIGGASVVWEGSGSGSSATRARGEMELFGLRLSNVRRVKESMEEENTKQVSQALRREGNFQLVGAREKARKLKGILQLEGPVYLKKRPRLSDQQGKSGVRAQVSMAEQPTGALVEGLEGVTWMLSY